MQILPMRNALSSKGFTLFELIIVIIIIGIIYALFVNNLRSKEQQVENITLLTMKQALLQQSFTHKSEIICFEPCKECYIYNDDKRSKEAAFSLFNAPPKVYKEDTFGQLREYHFLALQDAEERLQNVCFRFTLFNNKSSSYYLVEADTKFYLFHPYMRDIDVVSTLSDAKKLLDIQEILPREESDYDF